MNIAVSDSRVVLQPEDSREREGVFALFSLLEPPTCWMTLDIAEYDALDHDLARRRSEQDGWQPGARALVIYTGEGDE